MNELVSVIIPAKNESRNIERLLKSIHSQSYKQIEIIVVDDGSSDNTASLAKKYTKQVFTREAQERSRQRNFGASKAKGRWYLFLDADMELEDGVVYELVALAKKKQAVAITIPEKTVGDGFFSKIRAFERKMYMGDPKIEVARFFSKDIFWEFKGYDPNLTGPEDYDLPYRIGKKYAIYRTKRYYILHHEDNVSLTKMLRKKYYYASKGAFYAKKHPELIKSQGNLLFRKAYLTHWRNFLKEPVLGFCFIITRTLEALAAVLGYISAVGIVGFFRSLTNLIK